MKKIIKAAKNTILVFASIHILILLYIAVTTGNFSYINIFSILDLNQFYPGIENGVKSLVISGVVTVGIYAFFYRKKS